MHVSRLIRAEVLAVLCAAHADQPTAAPTLGDIVGAVGCSAAAAQAALEALIAEQAIDPAPPGYRVRTAPRLVHRASVAFVPPPNLRERLMDVRAGRADRDLVRRALRTLDTPNGCKRALALLARLERR